MMTTGFQITCANKNRQGTIVRIGGDGWSLSLQEAITKLMTGQVRLSILIGNTFFDVSVSETDSAFLVLEPDKTPLHDVESLPSC